MPQDSAFKILLTCSVICLSGLWPDHCVSATLLFAQGETHVSGIDSISSSVTSVGPIHWIISRLPTTEDYYDPQILREGLGFTLSQSGVLWKYDDGVWEQIPRQGTERISRYFALAENEVWASVKVRDFYRELLFQYNGKQWQRVESPNLYNIRAIYFRAPDDGWIGGEYGELFHYDGITWRQEKLPVFAHVQQFAVRRNGELLATTEAPFQRALLWRQDEHWQVLTRDLEGFAFAASPHDMVVDLMYGDSTYVEAPTDIPPFQLRKSGAKDLDFFPDGSGYMLQADRLFYFDEKGVRFVQGGLDLATEIDIFSPTFSWIVGGQGFLMTAGPYPAFEQPQLPYGQPWIEELAHQKVYGIGIIQQSPGDPRYLMLVKTGEPNTVLGLEELQELNYAAGTTEDSAAILNLTGSLYYTAAESLEATSKLTAFDEAIVVGDLNNDGWEDVIVSSVYGHPNVHLNSGRGYFFDATGYAGLLEWGNPRLRPKQPLLNDVDHDGDLDLFMVCQYSSNSLFVNDGYGRFQEVTQAAGLATAGGGIAALFVDIDNDGWDDLYVAHTNGPNRLYRNMGVEGVTGTPRFADYGAQAGAACWDKLEETRCVAAGDYDNDGDFDLLVFTGLADVRLLVNDGAGHFGMISPARSGLVLPENALAKAAVFVDLDNDGYLDLIVASHAPNTLYWGSASGEFKREAYLGLPAYHAMNYPNPPGQISNSVALVDVDRDGDVDAFIGNYETASFFLRNTLPWRGQAVQIFPDGVFSNRSAVGTRVLLYDSGHIGEPAHLRGLRSIQAGTAGGSSDEKMAHFGVSADESYDARVIFPSGIVRDVKALSGGSRLVVREAEGLAAAAHVFYLHGRNLARSYRCELRWYRLAALMLLIALGFFVGKRHLLWSVREIVGSVVVMIVSFGATSLLVFYKTDQQFFLWPLMVSLSSGLAVVVIDRFRGLTQSRGASLEALQSRLSAFGHGTLAHDIMNTMLMYATNLKGSERVSAAQMMGLGEVVDELLAVVGAEVQAILAYLRSTRFAVEQATRLRKTWRFLRLRLERLRRSLDQNPGRAGSAAARLGRGGLEGIAEALPRLKQELALLQVRLEEFFRCSVTEAIASAIKRHQKNGSGVVFEAPQEELPPVRFHRGDLVYLIDELIANALNAGNGAPTDVRVRCFRRFDEVMIDICDRGSGIARELWDEIFKETFTTKPASVRGGFGLSYARRTAERYGGQIYVHESEVGKGTVMRLSLRVAKPARVEAKAGQ